MKIIPSKTQWNKWSLPSKAGYIGFWIGLIGLIIAILIPMIQTFITKKVDRPLISITSVDSYLNTDSLETKFVIKNVGNKPAFVTIKDDALIDGRNIEVKNKNSESNYQIIMPDQYIEYQGLVIQGNTYQSILKGSLNPKITQNIKIDYGDTERNVGEYNIFESVRLDTAKLAAFKNRSNTSGGFWLLEKSSFK
jgi:hypothetical protein